MQSLAAGSLWSVLDCLYVGLFFHALGDFLCRTNYTILIMMHIRIVTIGFNLLFAFCPSGKYHFFDNVNLSIPPPNNKLKLAHAITQPKTPPPQTRPAPTPPPLPQPLIPNRPYPLPLNRPTKRTPKKLHREISKPHPQYRSVLQ